MPITSSAKKALRRSGRRRVFNIRRATALKTAVKDVFSATKADASSKLSAAYKAIDKAAKSGVIKKKTADRKKARLAKTVKNVSK